MREGHKVGGARRLRRNFTDAERHLWYRLRDRRLFGLKFRRQCPIGPYVADFVCVDLQVVVELDGGQHAMQQNYDRNRERFLQQQGFTVLRFWNNEVLQNLDAVLEMILNTCKCPHPGPLPLAGEGEACAEVPSPVHGRGLGRGCCSG